MTKLDKSKLCCMASAVEAASPHTWGPARRSACQPGSPANHFCSTELQAGSKLCFGGLLPVGLGGFREVGLA